MNVSLIEMKYFSFICKSNLYAMSLILKWMTREFANNHFFFFLLTNAKGYIEDRKGRIKGRTGISWLCAPEIVSGVALGLYGDGGKQFRSRSISQKCLSSLFAVVATPRNDPKLDGESEEAGG